ncbi:MAG: NAD(P)H-quinone oxidoreductase [Pyrinomonadaceae bacterium]
MKGIYITKFGDVESLELREIPDLSAPTGDKVLIRVNAAGLNRADLLQVLGVYPPPPGYSPNIPGLEFAGEVAAIGENVANWTAGDRVFGITAGEAQAELLSIDESLLTRIPESMSFTEAAAIPEAFITAHDAIFTLGGLKQGETLLIHAVGSGVGLAALQLAKAKGATVIGTSRTANKLDKCLDFGLDSSILSDKVDFADTVKTLTKGRGVDVIVDLVGAAYFQQNLECLALKGRLILVGLTSGRTAEFNLGLALQKRAKIIGTVLRARPTDEKAEATVGFAHDALPLFESGTIKPNLDRVFSAGDVISAYKYLQSNKSFGKVILEF